MKKNIIISVLIIIIVIQFMVINNINQHSAVPPKSIDISQNSEDFTQNDNAKNKSKNKLDGFINSYLMNNPIDNYYSSELNSKIEAEVRDTKDEYEKTWEQEYKKVIDILKKKCTYEIDRENLNNFKKSIDNLIETAAPVLETEILEAYPDDPDIPENRGWGNSTFSALEGIKGQIYRDVSMLVIPYLEEEYQFPMLSNQVK